MGHTISGGVGRLEGWGGGLVFWGFLFFFFCFGCLFVIGIIWGFGGGGGWLGGSEGAIEIRFW